MQGQTAAPHIVPLDSAVEMINTFVDIALRQDIWTGHEFWKPIEWSRNELLTLKEKLNKGVKPEDYQEFLTYCSDYIWHRLTNLSNMYEELVREWFMPTYLAMLTSYPTRGHDDNNSQKT